MRPLLLIKRLIVRGSVRFSEKAQHEMDVDGLSTEDVIESILNARRIDKVVRSTSPMRRDVHERLYIIKSSTYDGTRIYTKGSIVHEEGQDIFYILISAKRNAQGL